MRLYNYDLSVYSTDAAYQSVNLGYTVAEATILSLFLTIITPLEISAFNATFPQYRDRPLPGRLQERLQRRYLAKDDY